MASYASLRAAFLEVIGSTPAPGKTSRASPTGKSCASQAAASWGDGTSVGMALGEEVGDRLADGLAFGGGQDLAEAGRAVEGVEVGDQGFE